MKPRGERWELFRAMGTDGNGNPVQLWCWRHAKDGVITTPAVGFTIPEQAVADAMANGLTHQTIRIVSMDRIAQTSSS